MVRVVGDPAQELGLGQIIAQALGLTGLILILSLLLGLLVGGVFIWLRLRSARAREDGDAWDQYPIAPRVTPHVSVDPPAAGGPLDLIRYLLSVVATSAGRPSKLMARARPDGPLPQPLAPLASAPAPRSPPAIPVYSS